MLPGGRWNPGPAPGVAAGMRIDIWSDVICPFCWIGKRHLETALETFRAEHPETDFHVVWRAFELDPDAPREATETAAQMLSRKYGMTLREAEEGQAQMADRFRELGLDYDWRNAKVCSTFDAHRLAALAAAHGVAHQVDEALRKAHFTDGESIADPDVLRRIGSHVDLPADAVEQLLAGEAFGDRVREDVETARKIGIQGVPFFVFDGRLAVNGAQPVDVFRQALEQASAGPTETT